jgi:hypothetical protein
MPNYSKSGFLVDDQGRINVTTSVPSGTSTFVDGLAYDATGNLHITTTLTGTDSYAGGKRVSISGQLVVALSAAPNQPFFYNDGWPLGKVNGETIYQIDVAAAVSDAFMAGIRVGSLGVFTVTGGVAVGNHLLAEDGSFLVTEASDRYITET